jgi:hypothetical protein
MSKPKGVTTLLRELVKGTAAHAGSLIVLGLLGLMAKWCMAHIDSTLTAIAIVGVCAVAWITHRFAHFPDDRQPLRWCTTAISGLAAACVLAASALVPPNHSKAGCVMLSVASQEALIAVGGIPPLPDGQADSAIFNHSATLLSRDVPFASTKGGRVRILLFLYDHDARVLWTPSPAFTLGCESAAVDRIGGIWCNSPASTHSPVWACLQRPDRAAVTDTTAADLLCQPTRWAEDVLPNARNVLCVALRDPADLFRNPIGVLCIVSDRTGGLSERDVPIATTYAFALSQYLSRCTLPRWKDPHIHVRRSSDKSVELRGLQPFSGEAGPPPFSTKRRQ